VTIWLGNSFRSAYTTVAGPSFKVADMPHLLMSRLNVKKRPEAFPVTLVTPLEATSAGKVGLALLYCWRYIQWSQAGSNRRPPACKLGVGDSGWSPVGVNGGIYWLKRGSDTRWWR